MPRNAACLEANRLPVAEAARPTAARPPCRPARAPQDPRSYTPGAPPPSSQSRQGPQFAGSQPVSLDREKLEYIKAKRWAPRYL